MSRTMTPRPLPPAPTFGRIAPPYDAMVAPYTRVDAPSDAQVPTYDAYAAPYDAHAVTYDAHAPLYDARASSYDEHAPLYDALVPVYDAHDVTYDGSSATFEATDALYDGMDAPAAAPSATSARGVRHSVMVTFVPRHQEAVPAAPGECPVPSAAQFPEDPVNLTAIPALAPRSGCRSSAAC